MTSLNIAHFKTDIVTNMERMFEQCQSLTSLDISNFRTPVLENMNNMFSNCYSLTYLDISNFNTLKIQNFETLFYKCKKLTSLDLSSFDTNSVINLDSMFESCNNLEYLDLPNFNTQNLQTAKKLFSDCNALKWININNFDISKLTNLEYFFYNCNSLTSLDLSNFNTESIKNMHSLFEGCNSLILLDINNFDTRNVVDMGNMFAQCKSLEFLDLSNFNTINVNNINNMFYNCDSLQYLDITSFNTEQINNMNELFISTVSLKSLNLSNFIIFDTTTIENIFDGTNDKIILCYDESKMPSHFLNQAKNYENSCKKLCIMNSKKFILDIEMCVDNCYNETIYKYEYNNICYKECPIRTHLKNDSTYLCEGCPYYYNYEQTECIDQMPEGYYNNDTSEKTIDKCPFKCQNCSFDSIINNNNLCTYCNMSSSYYPKYNDPLNINSFYECYNKDEEIFGYFFDIENNIFYPCYEKCKKCVFGGNDINNNCTECLDNNNYLDDMGNCLPKYDENKLNNHTNKTELIRNIIELLINTYNATDLELGNDEEFPADDILVELTTTHNQKVNENKDNNKVYINIEECEKIVKKIYNISDNDSLYIIKIVKKIEKMKIPKVEYEVYYPLYNQSLMKLNLDQCKNSKMEISIPVSIDDDISKYDPKSKYYNDICSKSTSESDTDITLSDRKNVYVDKNMSLCEENCELINYNYDTERVKCSCKTKIEVPLYEEIKFNKELFYKLFADIKNKINIKVMKCYKFVFNKSLLKNFGFFIILLIILLLIITIIIFPIKSYT